MNTPTARRDFLAQLGAGAAFLAAACPLLGQSTTTTPTSESKAPESEDVARLRRQLQSQRDASLKLLAAVHTKMGPPFCDAVGACVAERYEETFRNRKVAGEPNLQALKAELWDKLPASFGWELVEQTPERLRFRVTRCPYPEEMKKAGVSPELGYALNCASDPGIARGINPAIKFSRTQTLMQGHPCCDHCYEMAKVITSNGFERR